MPFGQVFVALYEEGIMYRANRIINWCPRCHTALFPKSRLTTKRIPGELTLHQVSICGWFRVYHRSNDTARDDAR